MQVGEYNLLDDLKYDQKNNWVKIEGNIATFGISDFGIKRAQEIAFIELPNKGQQVTAGSGCGQIESAKWAGEVVAPLTGEIVEVNQALSDDPTVMNSDPYGAGWIAKIKMASPDDANSLMDVNAAATWIGSQK